jgi:hypothetical protein
MAWRKIKDLAVATGSYTDSQGQQKNRYTNVGSILKNDDGNSMILLHRHFNPAGVPFKDGTDQIIISMFDPKEPGAAGNTTQQRAPAPARTQAQAPAGGGDVDDDIPF